MAASLIHNAIQVYFDSMFSMADEGMIQMFKALESSGLRGFLGCSSAIYEVALVDLYHNTSVRDNKVISSIQGKPVEILEDQFAGIFELPTEGLTDMNEVSKDLVFDARSAFSADGEQLKTSCKKREMKFEFRMLNDILAKTITIKARSFDAVTHERFLMMAAIHGGVKINLGRFLFNLLKDMSLPRSNLAKVFRSGKGIGTRPTFQRLGKEPLVEEVVKGHPAREMFTFICADIEFLVQIREKVIEEIVSFFHSFSLCRLAVLESVSDIVAKEEQILVWAEKYSLQTAVQRRMYIIVKYREMLLRKFLEARHSNFESGTHTTATDLQILVMLSEAHRLSLTNLVEKMRKHQLKWTRPSSSNLFGTDVQRCEGERQYRTLISLLGSLATMRRVVNYHSSWARQRQVELVDASGNPGFTAGRGFNPVVGAPGGG
ncbi:hypothetical protein F511_30565 [Dorcoceras hygrometricum]|uniref:Uncharacterized protein n=1 Tax=Dorcoceras hygrometricum TaxID=472368 RepID=A0A2Z7BVA7_9LAMI|nr:hypothetical protein F511_30565 [Dorcoceras hygrometricum]